MPAALPPPTSDLPESQESPAGLGGLAPPADPGIDKQGCVRVSQIPGAVSDTSMLSSWLPKLRGLPGLLWGWFWISWWCPSQELVPLKLPNSAPEREILEWKAWKGTWRSPSPAQPLPRAGTYCGAILSGLCLQSSPTPKQAPPPFPHRTCKEPPHPRIGFPQPGTRQLCCLGCRSHHPQATRTTPAVAPPGSRLATKQTRFWGWPGSAPKSAPRGPDRASHGALLLHEGPQLNSAQPSQTGQIPARDKASERPRTGSVLGEKERFRPAQLPRTAGSADMCLGLLRPGSIWARLHNHPALRPPGGRVLRLQIWEEGYIFPGRPFSRP